MRSDREPIPGPPPYLAVPLFVCGVVAIGVFLGVVGWVGWRTFRVLESIGW